MSPDPFDDEVNHDVCDLEPEWHVCWECDGTGDDDAGEICPICHGKGKLLE